MIPPRREETPPIGGVSFDPEEGSIATIRLFRSPFGTVGLSKTFSSSRKPMLGFLLLGKKSLVVGAVVTGLAASMAQATIAPNSSDTREITMFVIGALSFVGSVIASTFVSGRMLGRMEQEQRGLKSQIETIDRKAQEWVDRNTLNMLDRLISEKILDIKSSIDKLSSERDHQYAQILGELSRLRDRERRD